MGREILVISLIATVLNEGQSIHRLMRSLVAQTRPPDEIVIVDGGSRDDTVAIMQSYADKLPLRIFIEPGCNISVGRNRAIQAARGEIIAVTDAGVVVEADWLEKIVEPLLADSSVEVVGGFFRAEATTPVELAMGATVLPLADEINPDTFLPTSRSVAFRKSQWQAVVGYPEWLDYCEDLIFDLRLKVISRKAFPFVPEAIVDFRPRGTLKAFFKQYYLYARGDGKADLWRRRHAIRYLTYLAAFPLVLLMGLLIHPLLWGLYIPGMIYYLYQPYRRLPKLLPAYRARTSLSRLDLAYVLLLIPVIRVVGDIAKMIGYPVGWAWRLRMHPPDWQRVEGN